MLEIKSIDAAGKITTRGYDNNKCEFYIDGDPVTLDMKFTAEADTAERSHSCKEQQPQEENERLYNRVSRPHKAGNISSLKIALGMACNFLCTYCLQHNYDSLTHASTDEDVDEFIRTFDSWCTTRPDQQMSIQFWGGEPLMYMAKLRKLIPFFAGRFEKLDMSMVTNGSLLTMESVLFFLEYKVNLVVSHDGPTNLKHRTGDPLAERSISLASIRYYHNNSENGIGFNAVITKSNHDLASVVTHIQDIVGGEKKARVGFEGIVVVEDENHFDDSILYSEEDYLDLREKIRASIATGALQGVSPFDSKFQNVLNSWFSPTHMISKYGLQKCGMDSPYTMAVTLRGDVLLCHSTNTRIGKVGDLGAIDIHASANRWPDKAECNECVVLGLCRGACMAMTGNAWVHTCRNEFHFNLAVFEAAFEYVFGEKVISISGHNHRPQLQRIPMYHG